MSRIKLLIDVIEDIRSLGDSLQVLANALSNDAKTDNTIENAKPKEDNPNQKKTFTLEEVRAVLADKSRKGYSEGIKELLKKHGADKLSEIDPSEYTAIVVEAEVIGSE